MMHDTVTDMDSLFVLESEVEDSKDKKPVKQALKDSLITLENDKLIVEFNTKGGQIASVKLKEYETYEEYAKKDGKVEALYLFKNGDASNSLYLPLKSGDLNTADVRFKVKNQTESRIEFAYVDGEQEIVFSYELRPGAYDLDYNINVRGFNGMVSPKNVSLNWDVAYRKTERLFSEQRRVSTICYNYKNEGFSYLSEITDDELEAEDKISWVGYKQSYFSSFMQPENAFGKDGSYMEVRNFEKGHDREFKNLKDFSSTLNLNLKNVDNASVSINWFFGPNDYKLLKSYDADYDRVLNYGWGLFRWINLYAVQPLFNLLNSTGMAIGIAILLLTFVIKFALMPIQWKMYTSSAKMRILKPEIESINKKYPDKEDAMKKQMETMALYRESGASPFSGCVPMLIQMPILLAVFRFFPSTFDLRQKSFLWAEDLSSYDSVYDFGFDIWFYGDHISLFTLLMASTTLIYTHINSGNMQQPQQEGMPNMKIIMYIFPIMMIFFFNNYSSGLSYYYFISTLTSILIMVLIKRFFVDEEKLKAKMAARKATAANTPKKAKSKFQERLEQMQKAQAEQAKNRKKK
jgi:YidC/Oxa1 family membrane protein insertase